jgi:hypothetical protein
MGDTEPRCRPVRSSTDAVGTALAYYQRIHSLDDAALAHRLRMPAENLPVLKLHPLPVVAQFAYARALYEMGQTVGCDALKLSAMLGEWLAATR